MDNKGFNEWAPTYEQTVDLSEGYPFEGYEHVLSYCREQVPQGTPQRILDIGMGTGRLSQALYEQGHQLTGLDFSEEMIRLAKERMPEAAFLISDFTNGLPAKVMEGSFDIILSTYAFHHVDDTRKMALIRELIEILNPKGLLVIGDIGFQTEEDRNQCQRAAGVNWDEEEYYVVADTFLPRLADCGLHAEYHQISNCAGVLRIWGA